MDLIVLHLLASLLSPSARTSAVRQAADFVLARLGGRLAAGMRYLRLLRKRAKPNPNGFALRGRSRSSAVSIAAGSVVLEIQAPGISRPDSIFMAVVSLTIIGIVSWGGVRRELLGLAGKASIGSWTLACLYNLRPFLLVRKGPCSLGHCASCVFRGMRSAKPMRKTRPACSSSLDRYGSAISRCYLTAGLYDFSRRQALLSFVDGFLANRVYELRSSGDLAQALLAGAFGRMAVSGSGGMAVCSRRQTAQQRIGRPRRAREFQQLYAFQPDPNTLTARDRGGRREHDGETVKIERAAAQHDRKR